MIARICASLNEPRRDEPRWPLVPKEAVELTPDDVGVRMRSFSVSGKATNAVALDFDDLPEALEAEPNDDPAKAPKVSLPHVLNGRIDKPGDVDCWSFEAKKGQAAQATDAASSALPESIAVTLGGTSRMIRRDEVRLVQAQGD